MKRKTVWPQIYLDRSLQAPTLRQRIERQLASAIRNGTLPNDCRLPSSRSMAKLLEISRSTVVDAYENLLAVGLIVARVGSGMRVAYASPRGSELYQFKKNGNSRTLSNADSPLRGSGRYGSLPQHLPLTPQQQAGFRQGGRLRMTDTSAKRDRRERGLRTAPFEEPPNAPRTRCGRESG